MSEELLLTAYERAWNLHDPGPARFASRAEGVREFRLRLPWGRRAPAAVVRGREAIARRHRARDGGVPDLVIEVMGAGYASDRRLWTEWRLAGTAPATTGGSGAPIEVFGVSVFRLSNAGFTEERLYWDSAFAR